MSGLRDRLQSWLRSAGIAVTPFEAAVRKAQRTLNRMVGAGIGVPDEISAPILQAVAAVTADQVTPAVEQSFYAAYPKLAKLAPRNRTLEDDEAENPFEDALTDAELLLKHAAENGVEVSKDIVEPILAAHTAYLAGPVPDDVRAAFYGAFSRLARLFGDVTADTIRNCTSPETRRNLAWNRIRAVILTMLIASFSVFSFVGDKLSSGIVENIKSANALAATLRLSLTAGTPNNTIDPSFARGDPCDELDKEPRAQARTVQSLADVEQLQAFASAIRDLRSQAIKLNWFVARIECDPFSTCSAAAPSQASQNLQLQLNPTLLNYPAEVLCKIKTYQIFRTFAANVQVDYSAFVGAVAAYALPIFYAWLGAFAYRLRLFGETIRKRTYHPSFSDSARMITAIIAGAIAGLFNPAQGLALSPLATAFLVGYGVELFFKFLDTLITAFGSTPRTARP